jgi:hypothetical protein
MNDVTKVGFSHLARAAYVYLRQSSPAQVEHNRESTQRQYALVSKATALGWPSQQVVVIDEDLGVSGSGIVERNGFARLTAEVALRHVGIVLGLEVSRLARNNADWYRLLDLCGLTDTLIGDADGLYHPALFNDRLLLGLKDTMSEVELHVLRARLLAVGEAFAVIRDAMRGKAMVALGRLVLSKRERVIALEPYGKGLLGTTLRYPYEVRNATDYFGNLPEFAIAPDMLTLAEHILDRKSGDFDPATFRDRYEEALLAHLKARQAGAMREPKPTSAAPRRVINLMEALRRSIAEDKKPSAAARKGTSPRGIGERGRVVRLER